MEHETQQSRRTGQELLMTAFRVSLWKSRFTGGVPQTGSNPIAIGDLSLYRDQLCFTGKPANVGTLLSCALHGRKTVDRIWTFDEIRCAESRSCTYGLRIDYNLMTITLTDGHSFSFSPALPWKKAQREHNIGEMDRLWSSFHALFERWRKVSDIDFLLAGQRKKGTVPDSQYTLRIPSRAGKPSREKEMNNGSAVSRCFGGRMELVFEGSVRLKEQGEESLEDHRYRLNGRVYTGRKSLCGEEMQRISEEVCIRRDAWGAPVLDIYTSIPAFDVYDREWDSWKHEYLMFDGRDINLVVARGGYRTAMLKVYHCLRKAPAALQPWLEQLGMPADSVQWEEK